MSVENHELAPFEPVLEELVQAREHTDQFGKHHSGGMNSLEDQQNHINYELAKRDEATVIEKVVGEINGADGSVLSEPQKAIAVKVLGHVWRTPMDESLSLISSGFEVFERVKVGAERNRGTVAVLGEKTIALYNSMGAEDLKVQPISYEKGHSAIVLSLADGAQIGVESPDDNSFPSTSLIKKSFSQTLMPPGYGNNPAVQMKELDPASEHYKLPFIALGTEERPQEDINEHLKSDAERYAARLLAITMGKHDWMHVRAPGEALKTTFVERFASIYQDLLLGEMPSDAVPRVRSRSSGMDLHTHVSTVRTRKRSLSSYTPIERQQLFYAADVSSDDIEQATREKIAKLEKLGTARTIARILLAQPIMEEFFVKIARP